MSTGNELSGKKEETRIFSSKLHFDIKISQDQMIDQMKMTS
jgi:hypothetical protein